VVQRVQDLESMDSYYRDDSTDYVFMLILDVFYQSDSYRSWLKSRGVWRSVAAFSGQKLKKTQTNRSIIRCKG
jgi:transposase